MTRVYIDISLFTPGSSVGVINGYMEVAEIPSEGGSVAFDKPIAPTSPLSIGEFQARLLVEHVLPPVPGTQEVMLSLADVTIATRADALRVAKYLEEGFGLYFDEH